MGPDPSELQFKLEDSFYGLHMSMQKLLSCANAEKAFNSVSV